MSTRTNSRTGDGKKEQKVKTQNFRKASLRTEIWQPEIQNIGAATLWMYKNHSIAIWKLEGIALLVELELEIAQHCLWCNTFRCAGSDAQDDYERPQTETFTSGKPGKQFKPDFDKMDRVVKSRLPRRSGWACGQIHSSMPWEVLKPTAAAVHIRFYFAQLGAAADKSSHSSRSSLVFTPMNMVENTPYMNVM